MMHDYDDGGHDDNDDDGGDRVILWFMTLLRYDVCGCLAECV